MKFKIASYSKGIIMFVALATISSSCKKYLELQPASAFDEQYVFSNVANAKSAVLGVYGKLTDDMGYGSRLSEYYGVDSDDMLGQLNTGGSDNGNRDMARYDLRPTNSQLTGPFNNLYSAIERANICIKNIPNMDLYTNGTDAEKKELRRLHGEALTLRALCFFELIKNWGDVPAPFEPAIDQKDLYLPKTDRDVIYDHILEDLKIATDLVPWRKDPGVAVDERITKGSVKGLRARIALFTGGYSLRKSRQMERRSDYLKYYKITRDECYDLMQRRDQHTLNPSFQSVFKDNILAYRIDPSGEVLLEISMGIGQAGKIGYWDGPRFYIDGSSAILGNGNTKVLPTYFYGFSQYDLRRDVTIAPYYLTPTKDVNVQTAINAVVGKFRVDWLSIYPTSANQYLGINWPLIRFSDILLMFAETENELNNGPTPEAIAAYEEVRRRGFAGNENQMGATPTSKDEFFKAIVDERWFEFGGETIRKYDLIRWNLLYTKILETRSNLDKMRNKQAPYQNLPQTMLFKTGSKTVIWGNSLYAPSPSTVPAGYTRINWISSINASYVTNVAQLFEPNHNELFPLPHQVVETNTNLKQDYGY